MEKSLRIKFSRIGGESAAVQEPGETDQEAVEQHPAEEDGVAEDALPLAVFQKDAEKAVVQTQLEPQDGVLMPPFVPVALGPVRVMDFFAEMAAERDALLASLESDSDSYREMVRTSIAESTSVIEKLEKSEEEAEAEIGRFFFDRGGDWIDETTPQEALDSVEKMLLSANRTEELRKNLDKLERAAKRDEYNALIESEEGKIKVLEEDKARLDAEIEEMKAEIARLRREIDKLGGDDDL